MPRLSQPRLTILCCAAGAVTLCVLHLKSPRLQHRPTASSTSIEVQPQEHDNLVVRAHKIWEAGRASGREAFDNDAASDKARTVATAKSIELVVCRYDEDVSWVDRLLQRAAGSVSASIMNHGEWLRSDNPRVRVWPLTNHGRECDCYLQHMLGRHPHFAERTLYVQADSCCHSQVVDQLLSPSEADAAPPFTYLTDKLWYNLSTGKLNRKFDFYNQRSCMLHRLFGARCAPAGLPHGVVSSGKGKMRSGQVEVRWAQVRSG